MGQNESMSPTLLIVEDDDTIRETIREALFVEGFDVTACEDGQEAFTMIEQHRQEPFSLIVLDLMLPGMSGLDL